MSCELSNPRLLTLPEIEDERGVHVLGFIEPDFNCPFRIERVYYMYDFPIGIDRGHHAHRKCHRLLVALSGTVEVDLELGGRKLSYTLASPKHGLFVPAPAWIVYRATVTGSVLMALASEKFDEADYIRDYDTFLKNS
jgi:hypothetical protein